MLITRTVTVSALLALYRKEYLPRKAPNTRKQVIGLHKRIERDMGAMRLDLLTPAFLRKWRDKLLKEGYAPGSVRRYMDVLSGPLTIAVRDYDLLPANPLRKVQKPPETPGRVRTLSAAERDALLQACQESGSPNLYILVVLALHTGARKMELMSLTWPHVDLERGMLRLEQTKNGERRSVPVTGLALTLLNDRRRKDPEAVAVFPANKGGTRPTEIIRPFRIAASKAGLAGMTYHDLRHVFASYLAMSGASTVEIAELLGHKQMAMVRKYVHFGQSHLSGTVERMGKLFLGE